MPEKIFYDLLRWIAKVFSYKEPEQNYLFPESKRAHSKSLNELLNMILLEELLKKKTQKKQKPWFSDGNPQMLGQCCKSLFLLFLPFFKKTREWVRWLIHENQWLFLLYKYGTVTDFPQEGMAKALLKTEITQCLRSSFKNTVY